MRRGWLTRRRGAEPVPVYAPPLDLRWILSRMMLDSGIHANTVRAAFSQRQHRKRFLLPRRFFSRHSFSVPFSQLPLHPIDTPRR